MGGAVELVSLADISPSHGWRGSLSQVLSLSSATHGSRAQEHKCVQALTTTEQQGGAGDLLRRRTRGAPPRSSGHRQLQVLRTPPDTLDQTRAAENKDVL